MDEAGVPEMRIADCGMRIGKNTNPKSEIPNPKFGWPMLPARIVLAPGPPPRWWGKDKARGRAFTHAESRGKLFAKE